MKIIPILLGALFVAAVSAFRRRRRRARRDAAKTRGRFCVHRRPDVRQKRKRVFRGPAERPHHGMERGRKTFHVHAAVRPCQRHVFRREGQSHRLRRRAQPALVHRAGQNRDRARHQLSRANTSTARTTCGLRPTARCIITDPFYRRTWWDHTTMALSNEEVFYLSPDRKTLDARDG